MVEMMPVSETSLVLTCTLDTKSEGRRERQERRGRQERTETLTLYLLGVLSPPDDITIPYGHGPCCSQSTPKDKETHLNPSLSMTTLILPNDRRRRREWYGGTTSGLSPEWHERERERIPILQERP